MLIFREQHRFFRQIRRKQQQHRLVALLRGKLRLHLRHLLRNRLMPHLILVQSPLVIILLVFPVCLAFQDVPDVPACLDVQLLVSRVLVVSLVLEAGQRQ